MAEVNQTIVDCTKLSSLTLSFDYAPEERVTLPLFTRENKNKKKTTFKSGAAIVYAENGSGKSTIARKLTTPGADVTFSDQNGNRLAIESPENVHVFDDAFIQRNFRFRDTEQLDPIILLGPQANLQDEIDETEAALVRAQQAEVSAKESWNSKEKKGDAAYKALKKVLQASQGEEPKKSWQGRTSLIALDNKMTQLRTNVIEKIIGKDKAEGKTQGELEVEFSDLVEQLNRLHSSERIPWVVPQAPPQINIKQIENIASEITAPELDSDAGALDAKVFEASLGKQTLIARFEELVEASAEHCPHCFQDISSDFRQQLATSLMAQVKRIEQQKSIEKLKSLKVEEQLESLVLPEIASAGAEQLESAVAAHEQYQDQLRLINEAIDAKIDNPASVFSISELEYTDAWNKRNEALETVELLVERHNKQFNNIAMLREKAAELNMQIARAEAAAEILAYEEADEDRKAAKKTYTSAKCKTSELAESLDMLRHKLSNTEDAATEINTLLQLAFGKDTIKLESAIGGGYVVSNRARELQPGNLSTGEQNLLALCYFFVGTARHKRFGDNLKQNSLYVLDDPISSFDSKNKYGALSLIRQIGSRMLEKMSEAKLLVLTHDIAVANDLSQCFADIVNDRVLSWTLEEGTLKPVSFGSMDQYKKSLQGMFDATIGGKNSSVLPTSNEVRRVWEAFTTFHLGERLTTAAASPAVRSYFASRGEQYIQFLDRYAGRNFLNPDSHSEFQLRNFDFMLLPTLSKPDFQRYVREMLYLIHIISPAHIPGRLSNGADDFVKIKKLLDDAVIAEIGAPLTSAPSEC
ncbi:AAA family ATPase [Corynebacterium diphtheriae]|uniref:AAA family ATPase n=1 Tax=Corynebacterium diphtheriae TaxID=1717 RepID=UPI001602AE92|nr:AAA family ATPase [Corynebacterium diphtheriae]